MKDGIEMGGPVFSLSFAVVYRIQNAGSNGKTVNGWSGWKTKYDKLLDLDYKKLKY